MFESGASPELLSDLRAAAGDDAVTNAASDLGAYARDLWPKLTVAFRDGRMPRRPDAVVRPATEDAVLRTVRAAVRHGVPVIAYGAGSGVCGGAAPLHGGVIVDLKRLDHLEPVDAGAMQVTCGPGIILQTLEERLNDAGWTLGHFPSSIFAASIGGCVAARGAGQLSSRYGKIEDMTTGLRVVTPGLGIVATGSLETRAHGIDWTPLFIGSEGTLGLITEIRLRVHPLPRAMVLRGLRFPSVQAGISGFREILQSGLRPSVMRLYDPLDTWMAMQKANDAGGASPTPGGGRPLLGGARARRVEIAAQPGGVPPKDAGTARVLGSVVSPGTFADSALKGATRGRSLLRRAFGRRRGSLREAAKATLLGGLADRLVGDQLKHLLKPENMPVDKLLANPSILNRSINLLPERCLAIFGAEGDEPVAREMIDAIVALGGRLGAIDLGPGPGEQWFRTRYHVSFKMPKLLLGGGFADTFETAAPWSSVEPLYDAVRAAVSPHVLVMAHLSHAYHEGCSIYFTFVGYGRTPAEADRRYEATWDAAMNAALSVGATLTHHHGVGALKRDFMNREHGAARMLYEAARTAVDKDRLLNVGKLFPDELPTCTPGPEPDPKALVIPEYEDGVAMVGVGWRGVDLIAELELRGHFVPPLGRDFLESTIEDWLRSGAVAAHHAIHGAWEHPVLAIEGRLADGSVWRSGRLPRSAAGPSYLPFGIGDDRRVLPVRPTMITLRSLSSPSVRMVGFVFDHMDTALSAMRAGLRGAPPPLDGMVFAGVEPGGFRTIVQDDHQGRDGGVAFLAFLEPDGFPSGTQTVVDRMKAAGGEPTSDKEALDWYEDQWAWAHRIGSSVLDATGPMRDDREIGRGAAVVGWGKAQLLLRAVETLTGGPTRAFGWIDAPRETGCTVRWRFTSTRKNQGTYTLLHHQVRETIRSFGARIASLEFTDEEGIPDEAWGGRGTPQADSEGRTTASEQLTTAIAAALRGDE
jgi:alkyldihydroxyacetonephosphate synthase